MNFLTKSFAIIALSVALPAQATPSTPNVTDGTAVDLGAAGIWVQVTETEKYSWNDFAGLFDTGSGLCRTSECIFPDTIEGDGIDLTGFTWASDFDVQEMLNSITLSTSGLTVTSDPNGDYIEALSRDSDSGFGSIIGKDDDGVYSTAGIEPLTLNEYGLTNNDQFGGWFFKSTGTSPIPEPSVIALLSIGLIGLGITRRRKSKK